MAFEEVEKGPEEIGRYWNPEQVGEEITGHIYKFVNDEYGNKRIDLYLGEDEDGEAWFIGAEICQVLGISETPEVYSILDEDEKKIVSFIEPSVGEEKRFLLVSEPGMYRLVLSSRNDKAKAFRKWLMKEAIPSILNDGGGVM